MTAKEGTIKDFFPVSHTVVFGARDSREETMVSFQIQIRDDDVVEHTEHFQLSLVNVVGGALIGEPSVAEVFIGDDDGKFLYFNFFFSEFQIKRLVYKNIIITIVSGLSILISH